MNLKTTIALILLTGVGAGVWAWWHFRKTESAAVSPTLEFFQTKLSANKVTRIEVTRRPPPLDTSFLAGRTIGQLAAPPGQGGLPALATLHPRTPQTLLVLDKVGGEWNLPGSWPVRPQETEQWLALLTGLRSRFTAVPIADDTALKPFGLDDDPLEIAVTIDKKAHTLRFGEDPDETNRFTRSSYVRLDAEPEVIRLGPGAFGALNRSLDTFRQRRLFTIERANRDEETKEKVEQVLASEVEVNTDKAKFILHKKDKDWLLKEAYTKKDKDWLHVASNDRIDPTRRDALLRAFPDLWAETFVDMKTLEETGLADPAYTITVTRPGGAKAKLLVGKVSRTTSKFQIKQGPMPIPIETKEEYRFAKLENNTQLFEIKTDKLGDITLTIETLRDAQLARFKADEVKRLEIRHGGQTLVFAKVREDEKDKDNKKEKWRLEKPKPEDVDGKQVEEFLEKVTGLQARDEGVLDKADLKEVGLDKPAGTIRVTVEEGKEDKKKMRDIVLSVGLKDKESDKVYVKVDEWPRVNKIDNDIWKLAQRSETAYRPRDLWKLERDAVTRITIEAEGKSYHLDRGEKAWKISGPVEADAPGPEIDTLAGELAHLKVERFETRDMIDLAKYGLDKPAFKISVVEKGKKPRVLEIGKRDDSTKEGGRFARLDGGDAIFVLSEKLTAGFKADPLDLLDKGLVSFDPKEIERIRYQGTTSFTLEKKKDQWHIVDAPAPSFSVDPITMEGVLKPWQKLRADRIAAVGSKIALGQFGLDKPVATITLTVAEGPLDKPKEHVVELGKETKDGGRYARFDKKDSIVVLNAFLAEQMNRSYVDFLDSRVLRPFDLDAAVLIERKMTGADLELARREDAWFIAKPGLREADLLTVFDVLRRTSGLQAKRIAAFPVKDLAPFGLDKPMAIMTLTLEFDGSPRKHVIKVGNLTNDKAKGEKDERFALVDDKQMVIVLSPELSRHLTAPVLYFADRNFAQFSSVDRAELMHGPRKLTFTRGDAWQIVEPIKTDAESGPLDELVRGLQRLRADEIVAEKGADLKKFGLDPPAGQWRFKQGDDEQLSLLIGAPENAEPGARRYAKLGNKNTVFLLNAKLSARVLNEFRSKKVWPAFEAGKVDELTVTGPQGAFVLKRKDKEWTVAGQPKAKVKANIVGDTTEMLANLSAHHYVLDAKADLKPYGLEKPAWKLEITTPTGKRELWIGAMDGKTKQPFATVAGSGTVFVLDEIDNIILARPLSGYVEADEKKK